MTLSPELTLANRYRLVSRIAVGGMGEVWQAQDELLGRLVAVKVLKAEYVDDADFLERFRQEARHTAALSHPGIANVFDYGEIREAGSDSALTAYLVMEYVEGEPLSALLARGRLEPAQVLDIVGQAGLALQAAHDAGVVHRDVKPGNLLVRPDGTVKVTDFGIARAADGVPLTQTGTVLGTAYYLSPEQGSGRPVGPASDVYSLGVVAYECLAGARPFTGTNPVAVAMAHVRDQPPALADDVPAPVRTLVEQTLEKDPQRRPDGAGTFGATALALREALYGKAPSTGPMATTMAATMAGAGAGATRALTSLVTPTGLLGSSAGRRIPGPADHRRRNLLLLAGLVGVLLLALLLHACGSGGAPTVAVPDVTTRPVADAKAILTGQSFRVEDRPGTDRSKAAGTVLGQDPRAGQRVAKGSTVTLTIAPGAARVPVNGTQYVGMQVGPVADQLKALGLTVNVSNTGSNAAAGTVTALSPTGQVDPGSTITVTAVPQPPPSQAPAPGNGKKGKKGDG